MGALLEGSGTSSDSRRCPLEQEVAAKEEEEEEDGAGLVRLADEVLPAATRAVDLEAADRVVLDRSACADQRRLSPPLCCAEGAGK